MVVPTDYPNIQAGIDDAVDGDTVLVLDGVYSGEGNYDILIINKGISLTSESGPENCIIDVQGQGRGLAIQSFSGVLISGFTIKNGSADAGGGIVIGGEGTIINLCILQNNTATFQGVGGCLYGIG